MLIDTRRAIFDKYCILLKNRVYLRRSHRYADEPCLLNHVSHNHSRSEHSSIRRATVFRWSCSLSRWCILLSKDNSMSVFLLSFVLFILLTAPKDTRKEDEEDEREKKD